MKPTDADLAKARELLFIFNSAPPGPTTEQEVHHLAGALADARAEGIRAAADIVLKRSNAMMVDRNYTAQDILALLGEP